MTSPSTAQSPAERVRSLVFLMESARDALGAQDPAFVSWLTRLKNLSPADNGTLRIAVAGTVKSGKTTLVNALVGKDLLKRGAGIVTSIVTRVRPGPTLRARLQLKGWDAVNREATDAALFLGTGADDRPVDLRRDDDRATLGRALDELGEEAWGEGGFFDKNVALLKAYLAGYDRVRTELSEAPGLLELGSEDFARHRDYAGDDALAAYVDDLTLELPDLPLGGDFEVGDCQGYDSPNPRHMEKVQQYLLGAHLVLYVVSSRVGLREADLRFLRDIKALGLTDVTRFVLNADLTEHDCAEDLDALRARVVTELGAVLPREATVYTLSALKELLEARRRAGETLERKEQLLLELWSTSSAGALDGYRGFHQWLASEVDRGRTERLSVVRNGAARRGVDALRSRVEAALALLEQETEGLDSEREALEVARGRVVTSLEGFERSLRSVADGLRRDLYQGVDRAFHPSAGFLAESTLAGVAALEPPPAAGAATDLKGVGRRMARIYQEMRASFQRYKVEEVNPRAVEEIRRLWGGASEALSEAARASAGVLVASVESYREKAAALGVEVPPLELPVLDPSIGRRVIPLFSAVSFAGGHGTAERTLSFAGQWTRKLAGGWARRLTGRAERTGFVDSLLADGTAAVRELLLEEARSTLLNYNEQVKFQVLGPSLAVLVDGWIEAYHQTVDALVVDLGGIAERLDSHEASRTELVPRLQGILDALEPLAA